MTNSKFNHLYFFNLKFLILSFFIIFSLDFLAKDCEASFENNNWTDNCFGIYQGRTERYEGQWLENRYHGKGKLVQADGRTYEGDFKEDLRHGQGKSVGEGWSYEGSYQEGRFHGQGTYEDEDAIFEGEFFEGSIKKGKRVDKEAGSYEGEFNDRGNLDGYGKHDRGNWKGEGSWKNGDLHGKGIVHYENGSFFEGEFVEGVREGYGRFEYADGEYYEGEWNQDDHHGKGVYQIENGSRYEGEFVKGKWHGQGIIYYSNGTYYEGEWKEFQKDGYGTETYLPDHKYEGYWKSDLFSGKGKYFDGSCYTEGTYVKHEIEGLGTWDCDDGFSYEGYFKNGQYHGEGTYTYKDGRIFKGSLEKNYFKLGKLSFTNGDFYIGEFEDDLMSGIGTYTFANGDIYEGNFRNDYFNGTGIYKYANGEIVKGTWIHDKFISEEFNPKSDLSELSEERLIKIAQELLNKIGYDSGEVNGVLGIKTVSAISAFQQSRNRTITGLVDQGLLVQLQIELRKITTLSFAQPQSSSKAEIYPVQATGTGFFISENIIATNYHVIEGCDYLTINYQEKISILKLDEVNDLAILKSNKRTPSFLPLSDDVVIGEAIYVGGFPHNLELGNFNFTVGNVSSLTGISRNFSEFQFTAPIQPGNSGGPILNTKGGVVGVTVSSLDDVYFLTESGTVPQNVNFGIKVSILKEILREIDVSFSEGDKYWFWGSSEQLADQSQRSSVLINCHQKDKS